MPIGAAAAAWITTSLAAVGTGVSVYSAVAQGEAANDAAKSQNQAAQAQAKSEQDAAMLEAGQVRRENLLRGGKNRAKAAKSGVLIGDSFSDVQTDTDIQGELDRLSVLYSGASQAGYTQSRGRVALAEGKAARTAGYVKAGGNLISGSANTVDKIPAFKRT